MAKSEWIDISVPFPVNTPMPYFPTSFTVNIISNQTVFMAPYVDILSSSVFNN